MFDLKNAFYAQAIADAVGRPFEFGNPSREKVESLIHGDKVLSISDDTQMAMFGLEGLCKPEPRIWYHRDPILKAYTDWYETQGRTPLTHRDLKDCSGLQGFKSMWRVEAPGNTCLSALASWYQGEEPKNNSNGCGTVMRLLPFACHARYVGWDLAEEMAQHSAWLTHQGDEIVPSTYTFMKTAEQLSQGLPGPRMGGSSISQYGEGWTALSCLTMALWALDRAQSFEELLTLSICHPGDSDSVAAVAGALWGIAGRPVPVSLINRLEQKPVIDWIVEKYEAIHG